MNENENEKEGWSTREAKEKRIKGKLGNNEGWNVGADRTWESKGSGRRHRRQTRGSQLVFHHRIILGQAHDTSYTSASSCIPSIV